MEKNVPSGLLGITDYDIRLHTLATNECQELSFKFEEKVKQSLVRMMNVYDKSVQDMKNYLQWTKYPIPFTFFQKLQDAYEFVKVEIQLKEFVSKEYIQEFFVNPTKEFSSYNAFIHMFMVNM